MGILEEAWRNGFSTKSDFARAEADGVATAASLGYITTQQGPGVFGRQWLITPAGLQALWDMKGLDV